MEILKEYTLVFWRIEDQKRFLGRRVATNLYVLRDPDQPNEPIRLCKNKLYKSYRPDKENSKSPVKKGRFKNMK